MLVRTVVWLVCLFGVHVCRLLGACRLLFMVLGCGCLGWYVCLRGGCILVWFGSLVLFRLVWVCFC